MAWSALHTLHTHYTGHCTLRHAQCPDIGGRGPQGVTKDAHRWLLVTTDAMHRCLQEWPLWPALPCTMCPVSAPLNIYTKLAVTSQCQNLISESLLRLLRLAAGGTRNVRCGEKCEMLWSGHTSTAVSSLPRCSLMVSFHFSIRAAAALPTPINVFFCFR